MQTTETPPAIMRRVQSIPANCPIELAAALTRRTSQREAVTIVPPAFLVSFMGKTLWNGGKGDQGSDPRRGVVLALPRDSFR